MNYTKALTTAVNGLIVKAEYEGVQPKIGQIFSLEGDDDVKLELIGLEKSDTLVLVNMSEHYFKQHEKLYSRGETLQLPVGKEILGREVLQVESFFEEESDDYDDYDDEEEEDEEE